MNLTQEQKTKMTRFILKGGVHSFVRLIMLTAWVLLIIVIGGVASAMDHKSFLNEWKDHLISYGGFGILAAFGDLIPYPRTGKKAALLVVVLLAVFAALWFLPNHCSCKPETPCSSSSVSVPAHA